MPARNRHAFKMDNELQLGKNIAFLVDDIKRTSRAELAAKIGISVTSVGQLIRGENKSLKAINLVKAARALGVTVEALVCDDLKLNATRYIDAGFSHGLNLSDQHAQLPDPDFKFTDADWLLLREANAAWLGCISAGKMEATQLARMMLAFFGIRPAIKSSS